MEDRKVTLPKDRGLTLICSEADFGGSFEHTKVKPGESVKVGCETDRPADIYLKWHAIKDGAWVYVDDYTDVGLADHQPFGAKDTIITVTCPQK